jgi:hypothetical protein
VPQKKFSDLELVAALAHYKGNITAVADELGVNRSTILRRKASLPEGLQGNLEEYRMKRADTFADFQRLILQNITGDKLKKASIQQLGTLFGIFYDKERLEHGQATEHIAHAHYNKLDEDSRRMIGKLVKEMTDQKLKQIQYEDQ